MNLNCPLNDLTPNTVTLGLGLQLSIEVAKDAVQDIPGFLRASTLTPHLPLLGGASDGVLVRIVFGSFYP